MKEAAFNFFEFVNSIDSLILLQRDAYFESVKAFDPEYKVSPREILNYINMTVDTDPDAAYMVFRIEEDWLSDEVDPLLVSYVDRRVSERKCYKDLDRNQFRFFRYSRHQIREEIDKNNYAAAIEDCDKARMNLDVPLFLYYKGKALYLSGKYEEAAKVLERYLEVGAAKFDKASYYLSESYAAIKEKDNYEMVKVTAKVAKKDKDGKRIKEVVDGKKVTQYDEVEKTVKKDQPSRLHARRQMKSIMRSAGPRNFPSI